MVDWATDTANATQLMSLFVIEEVVEIHLEVSEKKDVSFFQLKFAELLYSNSETIWGSFIPRSTLQQRMANLHGAWLPGEPQGAEAH